MPKDMSTPPTLLASLPTRQSPQGRSTKNLPGAETTGTRHGLENILTKSESVQLGSSHVWSTEMLRGTVSAGPANGSSSKVDEVQKQVVALKLVLGRTKNRLDAKSQKMLELKAEIQHMKSDVELMEEESNKKDELLEKANREFMKLLLNKVPEPKRDIELIRASQAHYLGHY
ncbi:hypothetical protein BKA70DRAFT_1419132 [Coprinopsis sp. MPI-PUGE-AT-0042]|nr:hypothetical protein BKA70DRAFT_1419132 [Coprinopsis sp. MPI-PUGE-AT-0042]